MPRIYIDNAATSFPKAPGVAEAMAYSVAHHSSAGRGLHGSGNAASMAMDECRRRAAQVMGTPDSRRIVFTASATDSLNTAIFGLCRLGDHVVTTTLEHNSVLRPLAVLANAGRISVTRVSPSGNGQVDPLAVRSAFRPNTRLVTVTHASNVTGVVQPVAEIGELARQFGALMLLDAAQTLGALPMSFADGPFDVVAAAGHKGLLGPLGTGLLYVGPGIEEQLLPFRYGGTGGHSELPTMPLELPGRYEAGNPNVPGLAGLGAALTYLLDRQPGESQSRVADLAETLRARLAAISGVTVVEPGQGLAAESQSKAVPYGRERLPIVNIQVAGYSAHELAMVLDQHFEIEARAGLHCAPKTHADLGTAAEGGTVRFSLGLFSEASDVDAVIAAVGLIARG